MSKLAIPRFPVLLRRLREERNLSQRELGALCNFPRGVVSQLENGWRRPTPGHLDRLEDVLGERWSMLWKAVFAASVPDWEGKHLESYRHRPRFAASREYEAEYRIRSAFEDYPERMAFLEGRILERAEHAPLLVFLQSSLYDSSLEVVGYSEFCSWAEALPLGGLSPMGAGFRSLAVVERAKGLVVGDRPHPALVIRLDPYVLTIFPQVRLRGRDFKMYRVDGLLGIKHGKTRLWRALDINGEGHDFSRDKKRFEATRLRSIALDTGEILSGDAKRLLVKKVRTELSLLRQAA